MKKISVKAPSSLKDIKLRQYQEFMQIQDPQSVDVVRIFLNIPIDVVNKVPKAQVESISAEVMEMFNEDCPMVNVFELNGKEFGFIPALNDMTYGEYTDSNAYLQDKLSKDLHKCMAVLYRPVIHRKKSKYLIEDYEGSSKYSEELLNMPVSIAMGCMVFFYNLLNDLLKAIPHYLLRSLDKEVLDQVVSLKSGDSITKYTQYQTSLGYLLTTLPNLMSTSA
jgi:hypothetical protein